MSRRILNNAVEIGQQIFAFVKPTDTPRAAIHEALREFDREDIDEVLRLFCAGGSLTEVAPGVYQRRPDEEAQKHLRTRLGIP